MKEFKNPDKEYRPIPFWSWNEDLKVNELENQIEEMNKAGLGGYFMHARSGLKLDYLGKEWFECIESGIQKGKEHEMGAWIYDEEGWPSGFAGGIVTNMSSDFHAKFMTVEEYQSFTEIDENAMIGIYLVHEDNQFERVSGNVNCGENDRLLAVRRHVQEFYIDVMSKAAVDAFISVTHEAYYKRFGEEFGKTMEGFFTDEPRFTCKYGQLPWSDQLSSEFSKRYHYDLFDVLLLLWNEFEGYEKVRYDFWCLVNDLFVTNYMKNIYDWCEQHNCKLTGHIMMEETIFSQMTSTGGVMPFYEFEHMPGIDWLRRRIENPVIGKQVGSVACQLGRKKVVTESFALTGWNVSFEELKWILEWQYVNGVNMLCQHLEAYSIKGSRKRDYPPSLFVQQSWWKEYKNFNDYVGRLGVVLSSGNQKADMLVLHPMRSGYVCFDGTRTDKIKTLDQKFIEISSLLSSEHISYHYGDETIIHKYGKVSENKFFVGEIGYQTVLLPHMYSIDEKTVLLLNKFIAKGGTVLSSGELPSYTNGNIQELDLLKDNLTKITKDEILPFLKSADLVAISISDAEGKQAEFITYQHRDIEDETVLFMVNHNQTETYQTDITVYHKTAQVLLMKAETGELEEIDYHAGKDTTFSLNFEPMQSYIVLLKKTTETHNIIEKDDNYEIAIGTQWDIKKMGLNSMTLDLCHYRIDDGELMGPIPAIKLMKTLLDLKRSCGIEMIYEFNVDMDLSNNKEIFIAMEDAKKYKVIVNGTEIEFSSDDYWKDISFQQIDIKPYVRNGKNIILLKGIFEQNKKVYDTLYGENVYETELNKLTYDMEIESIYLVGDFGVYSMSDYEKTDRNAMFTDGPFVIKNQPQHFEHNNFTTQGLLFFAEDLQVVRKIKINKEDGKRIVLKYGKHKAPMIQIWVNGSLVKSSLWAPYQVDITEEVVDGENEIEVRLFASNRNLLGPHHHIKGECYNVGPSSFTGEWSWVERESEADGTDLMDRTKNYWKDAYCFVEFGL